MAYLIVVKRILRYLKGTQQFSLHYLSTSPISLYGFNNAIQASCLITRRSTTSYCFFLRANYISWCSKKQSTIACSNTKAEYFSLAFSTVRLTWITSLSHHNYFVTMLVLCTCPLIQCFKLVLNILSLIFILYKRKWLQVPLSLIMFPHTLNLLIFLSNLCQIMFSSCFEQVRCPFSFPLQLEGYVKGNIQGNTWNQAHKGQEYTSIYISINLEKSRKLREIKY